MPETERKSWSHAELVAAGMDPDRYEIVDGEPVEVEPMGLADANVFSTIHGHMIDYVRRHPIGALFIEGRFLLRDEPRLERRPDIALVLAERMPSPLPEDIFPGAPDLAVEVLSPSDASSDVRAKAQEYLDAGSREVWVVERPFERVAVLRPGMRPRTLDAEGGVLESPLLPGFSLPVAQVFAPPLAAQ